MYCVKCGVELSDSEKFCPLCNTEVICPKGMTRVIKESPYPPHPGKVTEGLTMQGFLLILSFIFIVPFLICLICDLNLNGEMTWSGYVSGGLIFMYTVMVLPGWFKKPNPVIFLPIDFAVGLVFLLYISVVTGGKWFLSFAFPTVGAAGLIIIAAVTLFKYTRGGKMFILGGMTILFGGLTVLIELLTVVTFGVDKMFRWSLYPLVSLFLIGMFFIIVGICKPLKEALRKRLFF